MLSRIATALLGATPSSDGIAGKRMGTTGAAPESRRGESVADGERGSERGFWGCLGSKVEVRRS